MPFFHWILIISSASCCRLLPNLALLFIQVAVEFPCTAICLHFFFRFVILYALFVFIVWATLYLIFLFSSEIVWLKYVPTQHQMNLSEFRLKNKIRSICVIWICLPARTTDLERNSLFYTFLPQYALCVRIMSNRKQTHNKTRQFRIVNVLFAYF